MKSPDSPNARVVLPVAPLAGAWIEIQVGNGIPRVELVAPLAGAWIEITQAGTAVAVPLGRSPCGSVD